jgi:SAM-dependent methyltransferase
VLDVGAGTGAYADLVPRDARYLAVDTDPAKLTRLRERLPERETRVADASNLPLADDSFECGLCIALAHHLDDDVLRRTIGELRRVLTSRLVFLDPIASASLSGKLLWSIDRGSHPRPPAVLQEMLAAEFVITHYETYSIHHDYLLCTAKPR